MMPRISSALKWPLVVGLLASLTGFILVSVLPPGWRAVIHANIENSVMRAAFAFRQGGKPAPHPAPPAIIVVDIDSETISAVGTWPWPRERLAGLAEKLAAAQPAVLAFDMLLDTPDPRSPITELKRRGVAIDSELVAQLTKTLPDGDAALAQRLELSPAVLGLVLDPEKSGTARTAPLVARRAMSSLSAWRGAGVIGPYQPLERASAGLGVIALPGDIDGIIRRLPLFVQAGGTLYPGLALDILRVWQEASAFILLEDPPRVQVGDLVLPLPDDAMLRLVPHSEAGSRIRTVSAARVFEGVASLPPGAIILLGGSAPELGGLRPTLDDSLLPSVVVQAKTVAQLMVGLVPLEPPMPRTANVLIFLFLCGSGLWAALVPSPLKGIGVMTLATGVVFVGMIAAFLAFNWLLVPLLPLVAGTSGFAGAYVTVYGQARRREARIRQRFEQHLAPQVVSMIVANPDLLKLAGEKREISVLFTDVENFTPLVEAASPEKLIELLDEYFEGLAGIIIRNGGMIDKIVGDAVHALFNAPLDLPNHRECALAAALEIRSWSGAFRNRPLPASLDFGGTRIGVESGPSIVGDVGIRSKLDYTAHGAVVNTAARLEASNKFFGSTICLGPDISRHFALARLRPLGNIRLRGFSVDVAVFEPWPDATTPEWQQRYRAALDLRATDPAGAERLFGVLALEFPDDQVCRRLARGFDAP